MKVLCIFVGLAIAGKADYHEKVGIPLTARIKAYEDKLFAEVPEMEPRVHGKLNQSRFIPDEFAYPFVASMILELKNRNESSCAASIVDKYRLVTAAHCLSDTKSIKVRVGSQYLFHHGTQFTTTDFTPHPNFNQSSRFRDNDIGIVKIKQGLQFSDKVQPVALPLNGTAPERVGELAKAAGWGLTSPSQRDNTTVDIGMQLNEVELDIINVTICKSRLNGNKMPETIVCTSGAGGRGTCAGDSGGPLVVKRNGVNVLVGVTSYGDYECDSNNPSVFTRVASYLLFIFSV